METARVDGSTNYGLSVQQGPLGNGKEQTLDTHSNMGESQNPYAE